MQGSDAWSELERWNFAEQGLSRLVLEYHASLALDEARLQDQRVPLALQWATNENNWQPIAGLPILEPTDHSRSSMRRSDRGPRVLQLFGRARDAVACCVLKGGDLLLSDSVGDARHHDDEFFHRCVCLAAACGNWAAVAILCQKVARQDVCDRLLKKALRLMCDNNCEEALRLFLGSDLVGAMFENGVTLSLYYACLSACGTGWFQGLRLLMQRFATCWMRRGCYTTNPRMVEICLLGADALAKRIAPARQRIETAKVWMEASRLHESLADQGACKLLVRAAAVMRRNDNREVLLWLLSAEFPPRRMLLLPEHQQEARNLLALICEVCYEAQTLDRPVVTAFTELMGEAWVSRQPLVCHSSANAGTFPWLPKPSCPMCAHGDWQRATPEQNATCPQCVAAAKWTLRGILKKRKIP